MRAPTPDGGSNDEELTPPPERDSSGSLSPPPPPTTEAEPSDETPHAPTPPAGGSPPTPAPKGKGTRKILLKMAEDSKAGNEAAASAPAARGQRRSTAKVAAEARTDHDDEVATPSAKGTKRKVAAKAEPKPEAEPKRTRGGPRKSRGAQKPSTEPDEQDRDDEPVPSAALAAGKVQKINPDGELPSPKRTRTPTPPASTSKRTRTATPTASDPSPKRSPHKGKKRLPRESDSDPENSSSDHDAKKKPKTKGRRTPASRRSISPTKDIAKGSKAADKRKDAQSDKPKSATTSAAATPANVKRGISTPGVGASGGKHTPHASGSTGAAGPSWLPSASEVKPRTSLLANTLASLIQNKNTPSAADKRKAAEAERPRRPGGWTDELVLTAEQEQQYAASATQRKHDAARRRQGVTLNLQEAKDAYAADSAKAPERTILVEGGMSIFTTGKPSEMVQAVLDGRVRR